MRFPVRLVGMCLAFSLTGCQQDPVPSGSIEDVSGAQVLVSIWERQDMDPLVLMAEEARQEADRPDYVALRGVLVRLPLRDGDVILQTDGATMDLGSGQTVVLEPPIHFSGSFQGLGLLGLAHQATVFTKDRRVEMDDFELLFSGQYLRMDHMALRNDWLTRTAERVRSRPLPAAAAAALASLPRPLCFPPATPETRSGITPDVLLTGPFD